MYYFGLMAVTSEPLEPDTWNWYRYKS